MLKVGIERIDEFSHIFKNKRVGLITNPTGVDSQFRSTIDILNEKTNLVALYSPEHGVRGDLQAGVTLEDFIDPKTNCMVYSLYGKNKKPTPEMVKDIDIMAFDIQGVGARFYTFIYTLAYAMMSCKENDKKMVVFDRPNPVNAVTVEGNILDTDYRSFIGYYPLPQRYGLTIGELARLYNEEYKIGCELEVIPMIGYNRNQDYKDTKLNWILPSPNIPTEDTTYTYLATCIFEGTNMSEGRGTTKPFTIFGSPYLDNDWLKRALDKLNLKGVEFRPLFFTPTFSKHSGVLCNGLEIYITDKQEFRPVSLGFILVDLIRSKHPEFSFNKPYKMGLHPMIDLNVGGDFVRRNTMNITEILTKIKKDSTEFKSIKRRYHLYE